MESEQATSRPAPRAPRPEEVAEVLACVPPLPTFFHRARFDMPPAMRTAFDQHNLGPRGTAPR